MKIVEVEVIGSARYIVDKVAIYESEEKIVSHITKSGGFYHVIFQNGQERMIPINQATALLSKDS